MFELDAYLIREYYELKKEKLLEDSQRKIRYNRNKN